LLVSAAICGAVVTSYNAPALRPGMHEALAELRSGRLQRAERIALALAEDVSAPSRRAWLIVATARERQGRHQEAADAYRRFLTFCDSTELRRYVLERIDACRSALNKRTARRAPSKRLTPAELTSLAAVEDITYIESTDHFVVRARNAAVAELIASEAEAALGRISRELLNGREYPHSVDIYVWANRGQYRANAPTCAPEWSNGSFAISFEGDLTVRRIDLTQLEADGNFATVTLDRILPHEMCHLVLKEFFGDAPCPLTLNEGLAMLAEAEIDNDRVTLAGKALTGKAKIPLGKLIVTERVETPSKEVFYAEAFSFLEYLHSRLTRRQFRAFLDHVKSGCAIDEAIQRAIFAAVDDSFMPALAAAWEQQAVADWQTLEALNVE
jgi:hypothetical protein